MDKSDNWPPSEEAVKQVRELLRQHLERSTVRELAPQVGLSRAGLNAFVNLTDRRPQRQTWAVLRQWRDSNPEPQEHDTTYREIPVEDLRAFYDGLLEEDSLWVVAKAVGMEKNTLWRFLGGAEPHPQTRRVLGLYYLHEKEHGPEKRHAARNLLKRARARWKRSPP